MSLGLTLALDGSTYAGSVAVLRDRHVVAERVLPQSTTPGRSGRDENFLPMVVDCLADAAVRVADLDRVVCGAGPGSFTSLRVAASIAKGIAVGAPCPLFAVSSLALMLSEELQAPHSYLALLPAMRGEVYAASFQVTADGVVTPAADVTLVAETAVDDLATTTGSRVIRASGSSELVRPPHARVVSRLLDSILQSGLCDIDTWEPSYGRLAEAQVKWEAAHGRPLMTPG